MQTLLIQTALKEHGFSLGPAGADGVWGRASIAALKLFQTANHLPATGVPDSATLVPLFGQRTVTVTAEPLWFEEASRLKGTHEKVGAGSNPVILGWAQTLSAWVRSVYKDDATPWCGLFVAHCIGATLPAELLPSNPLSALAWAKFGVPIRPAIGAVCVFRRVGGGHVGFYAGEDADAIHVLGGNQSDNVTIARVPKTRLVALRWPTTAPAPATTGPVLQAGVGSLSRNEA